MADGVRYFAPGCVVEYMEGNAPQIALIMEASDEHLRLLLPNRRETRLAAARMLPWSGPGYEAALSIEHALRLLDEHKKKREALAGSIAPLDVWEIAQGEIAQASAQWFGELFDDSPDADTVAAAAEAKDLYEASGRQGWRQALR